MVECRNCGNPDISMWHSGEFFQFCSFNCQVYYFRYFTAFLTFVFFLLMIFKYVFFFVLVVITAIPTLWAFFGDFDRNFWWSEPGRIRSGNSSINVPKTANFGNGQEDQGTLKSSEQHDKSIYIKELGREFDPCCYQSARLGDTYCPCGKAVDAELIKLLSP